MELSTSRSSASIDNNSRGPSVALTERNRRPNSANGTRIDLRDPTPQARNYQRLNQVLDTHAFDAFVEAQCAPFYAATVGRPSLLPGTYFRLLLIGYFEGIDSERGIAWRTADSLALRGFLGWASMRRHPSTRRSPGRGG